MHKAQKLNETNPRRNSIEERVNKRTQKPDWLHDAEEAWQDIFEGTERVSAFPEPREPWIPSAQVQCFYTEVSKREDLETQKAAAMALLDITREQDITFYTDGSASHGNSFGGAGVVIETPESGLENISFPAGRWTSSYQAELEAIKQALQIAADMPDRKKIRIVTDSRSAVQHMESNAENNEPSSGIEEAIHQSLERMYTAGQTVTLVWCPGHCKIDGNEVADRSANEGARMDQTAFLHTYETSKAVIKRYLREPPICHPLEDIRQWT